MFFLNRCLQNSSVFCTDPSIIQDKGTVDKLKNLKEKEAEYIQQIESEKEKIKDFDTQIRKMEKSIRDQHKNMGG